MKKYLGICKKYSFIISAAALVLYVLIEAADSIIGAFRGYNLFDFGVIFNIALIAAGALMLFRQVKFAAIPFGVAALVNIVWLVTYIVNSIINLLNFGFRFLEFYPLGIFNILFSFGQTIFGLLAMIALGALCVLVVLNKLPNITKHWYIPAGLQAVAFVLCFLESAITFVKLLFGPAGFWMKALYFYDFGSAALIGLLLLAAVAFSGLAVHTYTLLPENQKH